MLEPTVSGESTVIGDRRSVATMRVERLYAEVLTDVLGGERVSVDSHFFEE